MNEKEKRQAQAEALRATAASTADRSSFWAGLNKFLAANARREHTAAERSEREDRPE
jgi:hypothetical protein